MCLFAPRFQIAVWPSASCRRHRRSCRTGPTIRTERWFLLCRLWRRVVWSGAGHFRWAQTRHLAPAQHGLVLCIEVTVLLFQRAILCGTPRYDLHFFTDGNGRRKATFVIEPSVYRDRFPCAPVFCRVETAAFVDRNVERSTVTLH